MFKNQNLYLKEKKTMDSWIKKCIMDDLYVAHDALKSIEGILTATKERLRDTEYEIYRKKKQARQFDGLMS